MRKKIIKRKTRETQISLSLNIDGSGKSSIDTGVGILDHMLELFAFHGFFDLQIKAKGDLKVDIHHTNEDVGIVLGQAFKEALSNKKGIRRFGFASVPMEDVLVRVSLDISGRGHFKMTPAELALPHDKMKVDNYSFDDAHHFLEALTKHLGMNLNVFIETAVNDLHTDLEPVFKALGLALDQATQIDPRRKIVPSTKGVID